MSQEALIIFYNPRCGKCRMAKTKLEQVGYACNIVEYLQTPLNAKELTALLKKLGKKPIEIIRKKEDVFKEKYADKKLTDAQYLQALVDHPILMERPIVVKGNKAWVARSEDVIRAIK